MKVINLGEKNSILNKFVAQMRDKKIQKDSMRFRKNLERLGNIFAYEISQVLESSEKAVNTTFLKPTVVKGVLYFFNTTDDYSYTGYCAFTTTDEDGELAAQLEGEFAEMNGWEAETEAGQILSGLGLSDSLLYDVMVEFTNSGPKGRDFEVEEIEDDDDNFIEPIF